jgi:hypothetical protein
MFSTRFVSVNSEQGTNLRMNSRCMDVNCTKLLNITLCIQSVRIMFYQSIYAISDILFIDPDYAFCVPFQASQVLSDKVHWEIATYFSQVLGGHRSWYAPLIPNEMDMWGKLYIRSSKESIRTVFALSSPLDGRNSSYIQVSQINYD